ncbi:MAG: T9SS type A sorting domain-containing protein [Calditrichaeota bacterium]|nr:T9SS type A sorting domain-containing protein [Calditrichota bacterium]
MAKRVAIVAVVFGLFLGLVPVVHAQNYLDVPPDPNFAKDYLNNVIYGDTTESGDRVPDRVYRLQAGGIYYFNNIIKLKTDLKIVAEGEGEGGFNKAIILTGLNDQGKQPSRFADVHGDICFKNLYFSLVTENDKQVRELAREYKDGAVLRMENCFVEWPNGLVFRVYSANTSLYIKDSYFRNITNVGGPFAGKIAQFQHNPVNEIVLQNNTMANIQGPLIAPRFNTVGLFKFDHNTVVNELKWPFHFEYWTNGVVTNNIFFNVSAYGENRADASNQDQEGLVFGIINLYTVPDSLLPQVGLTSQSERRMEVHNNLYYHDEVVKAYLAKWWEADSVREEPWMNERSRAWAEDDSTYPYLNIDDPIEEDPEFVEYPTADSMVKKMDHWRSTGKKGVWWYVDDDGNKVSNPTDRPHDLSFPTTSVAYTAAEGGFPLGDLNWFPEKKAEWVSAVEESRHASMPAEFGLLQNYPNPFNPTTRVVYSLEKSGKMKLVVYDLMGRKVRTLVDGEMPAGQHVAVWDGRGSDGLPVASGIYLCRLESAGKVAVRKMILSK